MSAQIRRVDPVTNPGAFVRGYSRLATTRPARFISRHVSWKLDPMLLRASGGRVATTLVFPTQVLETDGALSGKLRRNAIIYFHDGDRVIIVASNAGASHHPSWYHNLIANPQVTFAGIQMLAMILDEDEERQRLWALADRVFPAFATYRHDAAAHGRSIPLIALANVNDNT